MGGMLRFFVSNGVEAR